MKIQRKTFQYFLFFILSLIQLNLYAADYTNSIGMKFNTIPAGSFYMGSCKLSDAQKAKNKKRKFLGLPAKSAACPSGGATDNDASDDETPQHKVRISQSFQIGVYEVTLGQFKQFILKTGRDGLLTDDFIKWNSNGDRAAVSMVSWNDAQNFINWLNKKEGGNRYRLPTEAEWEYAARAGTTSIYSWGNSKSKASQYAWYNENGGKGAKRVGGKKPNNWGLYDMHGNVWEWVQDKYDKNYYANSPSTNPKGASSSRYRVSRGGGWYNNARGLRSASRDLDSPGYRFSSIGFRLVRTL